MPMIGMAIVARVNMFRQIYIQRLLFLEYALPYKEYSYLGWLCRPPNDHFTQIETVRRQYMLPGSLTPLGEFQSLRCFGKSQALLDPPSFFLHWSPDGNTVSLENISVTLDAFRALPEYFIRQAEESNRRFPTRHRRHNGWKGGLRWVL
jgi:hypothetical protein